MTFTIIQHKKPFLTLFILVMLIFSANAQWNIPDDAKNMKAPTVPTYKSVEKGKLLFSDKCMACHGMPGEGNNNVKINAPDLGTPDYQSTHNAGAMYFQFNEGMGAMPSFKNRFSEDEKWNIVFFVKSFDKTFKITGEKIKPVNASFDLKPDESASQVFADVVIINEKGDSVPASDIKINFFVKRIFGNLPIGDPVKTNENGTAVFNFPNDITGDKDGNVEIIAEFNNSDKYGDLSKSIQLNWGKKLHYENPVLERSLWGPNNRVPIWLLITYLTVVGGVWLTIFYVVFKLIKLKNVGK